MMPGVVAGFPRASSRRTLITLVPSGGYLLFQDPNWGSTGVAVPEFGTLNGPPPGSGATGQIHEVTNSPAALSIRFAGEWASVSALPWSTFHFGNISFNRSAATHFVSQFGTTLIEFPSGLIFTAGVPMEVWAE